MRRLFLSDLHLTEPDHPHFRTLEGLLTDTTAQEIYLLGDLCEVWVGDDDDGPLATAFVALLGAAARRANVFVMHGNRDFLYGEAFAAATGARLLEDPHRLPDGILLSHGDGFCIDDHDYQQARRLLRSAQWQRDVLARPLAERRQLASAMREQSRRSSANKAQNIMDVAAAEVAAVAARHDVHTVIHGHTHRPGVHDEAWGRRYVLGAWERCAWTLVQDGAALTLAATPLLGGSAGAASGPL